MSIFKTMTQLPPDISESYTLGSVRINAFATSGSDFDKQPNTGQADAHTVTFTPQKMTAQKIGTVMDMLQAQSADNNVGSTGILTAISASGGGTFSIATGARGNSEALIITLDAQGRVIETRVASPPPEQSVAGNEFGALAKPGQDLFEKDYALKQGEKLVVVAFSDGLTDAFYTQNLAATWQRVGEEVAQEIKRSGAQADIARFLSERAHALGSPDNISVAATVLDASSQLRSGSVVMAIFDGTGKADGSLSNTLAQSTAALLTQGVTFDSVVRREQDHISQRVTDAVVPTAAFSAPASTFIVQAQSVTPASTVTTTAPRVPAR